MRISDWSSDVCSSDLYGARILEFVDKQQVEFVGQRRGDCGIVERPEQQRFLIREVENTQFALALRIRPQRCGSAFKNEPDVVTQIDEIGRAHVWPPVTNAHLVCRHLLEQKTTSTANCSITKG